MSVNKSALIRYKILDKCFRNPGKKYFISDLIEECEKVMLDIDPESKGISRRQIFDDILFMESSEGWSVELNRHRDGKKVYYRYSDISFSINNMPLNEVELNHLKAAIDILSQFRGMPQFEWFNEMLPKLEQRLSTENHSNQIIDFDNNQYLKGIELLGVLYNAIRYKKVLLIQYKPFDSEVCLNFVIHPYYLKQYNNRWFLFGFNPDKGKYDWNLAIDRIIKIDENKIKYLSNKQINWNEYFEDIIGVTKPDGADLEKVILHFNQYSGQYMVNKPIHVSQKTKCLANGTLELSLNIIINYELERLILSYADSVKVIQPKSLLKTIKQRLNKALDNY
ncbi:MAG: helix-turn-helix transcriptional regulator [Bacteroidota bacterium]